LEFGDLAVDDDVREGLMRHVEMMNKNWDAGTHYIVSKLNMVKTTI
jgi:hypothetical protein